MSITASKLDPSTEYLGDGVYAAYDGYHIELFTHNGYSKQAIIYLELSVYSALRAYGARMWELKP